MTPLVQALDAALLHFLWQGLAVAALLWVALAMLRNRSANARYLASCVALAMAAALPLITAYLEYAKPAAAQAIPALTAIVVVPGGAPDTDWLALLQRWLLPLWACGVTILAARLLWGCARVARLKREGEMAEPDVLAMVERLAQRIGIARPVRVLISRLADGPSVVGWLRPVLLLPAATLLGLTAEQLEAVLAHELAHIRRWDYLVNLAQMLVETALFYHPAVWWISARIRKERELCCDDIAVGSCGDALCYARALTALERMRVSRSVALATAAVGAKDGPLKYRIERLLGAARPERTFSRAPAIAALCLGLICGAAALDPVQAQAPAVLPTPPVPQAPILTQPSRRKPARRLVAQVAQAAAPTSAGETVTVEVSIDRNGDVSDARVISGPQEGRRGALLQALSMHFPQDGTPSVRYVTLPASGGPTLYAFPTRFSTYANPTGIKPVPTPNEAQEQLTGAIERLARYKAQQAAASERGSAQLQEAIDAANATVTAMQSFLSGRNPLAGKALEVIRINGPNLSDDERGQILNQLPVRLHEVLSEDSIAAIAQAVRRISSSEATFGTTASGDAALIINVPARGAVPVR